MIAAMSPTYVFLILIAPFVLAGGLSWAAHRSHELRIHRDQFRIAAPMSGRLSDDDRDLHHIGDDPDGVRARFERNPSWPVSGALGERR